MAKPVLNRLTNLTNPSSVVQALNENFDKIEQGLQDALYRDGSTPNQVTAPIDMNSNRIVNLGDGSNASDAVTVRQLETSTAQSIAVPAGTVKGRVLGSGTGPQVDLTPTQLREIVAIGSGSVFNVASQAQAEAGTDNITAMTPLRTAQQFINLDTKTIDWLPDLTYTGIAGNPGRTPLVNYLKGAIFLEYNYPGLTWGVGVTTTQRNNNTAILNQALIDSGVKRRPLIGRAGAILEIGYIDLQQDNVEFDLNGMTLRHGATTHTTMLFIRGASAASRIKNFWMYNGTLDANAQAKGAGTGYYPFSSWYSSYMKLEDLTIADPWNTAWIVSDPYPGVGGYPTLTSDNFYAKNIRVTRSAANIAKIATNPSMMQGDQAVVTGIYNARLENIVSYYSGRSGLSYGLNDGGYIKDFQASACWTGMYIETLSNCRITGFDIRDFMPFDGDFTQPVDCQGIWFTDGDQSAPGLGLPTGRNVIINDGTISNFSVTGTGTKNFHGIRVSGRNGADHAIANQINNVVFQGIARSGGPGSGIALTLEGQLTGVRASNIVARQCDIAYAADRAYTAPGGSSVNVQTDTWVDGLQASGCGYSMLAQNAGGAHVRSGVRNVTGGGAAYAIIGSLALEGFIP